MPKKRNKTLPPPPKKGPTASTRAARRRWRVRVPVVVGCVVVAVGAWYFWRRAPSPADGPIILISIDTLRADHLPVYGYAGVRTPNIDALTAEGILFERAYAHSPLTFPSHASILSGRLPFETGIRDNIGFTLGPDLPLLSRLLHDRGFVAGGVVSAYIIRQETGLASGFDFYDSQMPPSSPEVPLGQVQRDGSESARVAERWMEGLTSPRLFLFFHIYEPHKPYTPPARFGQYAPYDGEIAYSDEIVGGLLGWLKTRGWYDRATIVLLSDHGEGLGDHGEQEHGLFLYNETTRVPLIVKLPRGAHGGRRVLAPVQHIDLVPTVLDLIGAPRLPGLRGRSLKPLLEATAAGIPEQGIYAESLYARYHYGWSELLSLTDERYRLIKAPKDELYDLNEDPKEQRNVATARAQTRVAMRAALQALTSGAAMHLPAQISSEDRQRLAALGYVGSQPTIDPAVPGEKLPDPKDKVAILEMHRRAVDLAGHREHEQAIALLRAILADSPKMKDVWIQLASELRQASRDEEALAAYRQVVELDPTDPAGLTGGAAVLLGLGRLDEAAKHAAMAVRVASAGDAGTRASADEIAAKVALARGDAAAAAHYAALAREADPTLPLPTYVNAMLLYWSGKYEEALPLFEETSRLLKGRTLTITDLHFYTGDTLGRLGRGVEAEAAFKEEIRLWPQHVQARSHLAMLYRAQGRNAETEQAIAGLLRVSPTPNGYAMAIRLWMIFGERERASALRADGTRKFGATPLRQAEARQQQEAEAEQRRLRSGGQ